MKMARKITAQISNAALIEMTYRIAAIFERECGYHWSRAIDVAMSFVTEVVAPTVEKIKDHERALKRRHKKPSE